MGNRKRLIIFTMLCLIALALSSCRAKDIAASNESNNMKLYPASAYENYQIKWGYINQKGEFIIKPSFDMAEDFQNNGLAFVRDEDDYGIIDRNGNYISEQKFEFVSAFSEGIAIGYDGLGYKAINEKGQIIFEANDFIGDFKNNMAMFRQEITGGRYQYGFIDKLGKIVIEPKYQSAEDFLDEKAIVKLGDYNYEIIDKNGKTLSTFNYSYLGNMGEGLIAYKENDEDKLGYMDEKGGVIIPPSFDIAEPFAGGLALVGLNGSTFYSKYGLINKKGEYVIDPDYNEILDLGEGMFAAGVPINSDWMDMGCKYAIANSSGELLTDFVYYGVGKYNNGLASANDNISTFFINKEGKRADKIGSMDGFGDIVVLGDVIKANIDNRLFYTDSEGNLIWKTADEYKITQEINLKELKFRPNRNFLIYYPEINGLADMAIQDNINENLKKKFVYSQNNNIKPEDDLEYHYEADFSISFYNKNLLAIVMTGYDYPFGAIHGMPVKGHSHIDLSSGKFYELRDLFRPDSNYIGRINSIIKAEIDRDPDGYFPDAFKGVMEEQNFIITKDGLHIYFTPYEIAAYAAGFPEFEIPYKDIMDIINTEGELWKAFN